MNNTRDTLIDTMKTLLWQRGYDATSPNQVLEKSGVGKGSLYHHFKSKKELAVAAMDNRADELIAEADQLFIAGQYWLSTFEHYLLQPRDGMAGCRLGRITLDPSVIGNPDLQRPIKRYFTHLHKLMNATLSEAQESGYMCTTIPPQTLAYTIIAVLQGGFLVSRACNDGDILRQSVEGVYTMLESLSTKKLTTK
jgi:TetR/AcrR family transcriptional repressor of nem operon